MILIKNAGLYLKEVDKIKIVDILIEGSVIKTIQDTIELGALSNNEKAEVIDATGLLAAPGFINAHNHSSMSLFKGFADNLPFNEWHGRVFPYELKLTKEEIYWGSMLSIIDMIKSGTTMFNDMYIHMDGVAQAVQDSGIRAALGRGMIFFDDNVQPKIDEALSFATTWNHQAEGRITTMMAPHSLYLCSKDQLKQISKAACENKLPLHTHFLENTFERTYIRDKYDMTPAQLLEQSHLLDNDLPLVLAHGIHVEEDEYHLFQQHPQLFVVHCPISNYKLACGTFPMKRYEEYDIPVCLGTDGPSTTLSLDLLEQLKFTQLVQKNETKDLSYPSLNHMIDMTTKNGAKALGKTNLGEIKEGYLADINLIKMDQKWIEILDNYEYWFTHLLQGNDVDTTIVNGRILMQQRKLRTINEKEVNRAFLHYRKKLI